MKPMLFSTEMVRGILDNRKTVTRRIVKPHYYDGEAGFQVITNAHTGNYVRIEYYDENESETRVMRDPYRPGDILYVRESFYKDAGRYMYKANYSDSEKFYRNGKEVNIRWCPSIHMPRDAARIFLRVTDVRVERLQAIMDDPPGPENQVVKEGCKYTCDFIAIWDSTINPANHDLYGWDANPWVWVIEFERITKKKAAL